MEKTHKNLVKWITKNFWTTSEFLDEVTANVDVVDLLNELDKQFGLKKQTSGKLFDSIMDSKKN